MNYPEELMAEEPPDATEPLLKVSQVAQLLNVKTSTIYYWVHKRIIPHIKFPGALRFHTAEVTEWIEQHKRRGRPRSTPPQMNSRFTKNRG